MRKPILLVASTLLLLARPAAAQEIVGGHGPGVGVEGNLGGLSGAAFVYDASHFHVDLLFELQHFSNINPAGDDETIFGIGGRFLYSVSQLGPADFSIGGGLGIIQTNLDVGPDDTEVQIEGLAQIRAFIVPNVALTASLGLVILTDNVVGGSGPVLFADTGDSAFGIGGNLVGDFGLIYFFR